MTAIGMFTMIKNGSCREAINDFFFFNIEVKELRLKYQDNVV